MTIAPTEPTYPQWRFRSQRNLTLRFVTLVCAAPVPLTVWLLTLAPAEEWREGPFGPALWWLLPAFLLALAAALPASLLLLHDRYVLALEQLAQNRWRLTTFVLWGVRRRELDYDPLQSAKIRYVPGTFDSMWAPSVDAPYLNVTCSDGRRLIFDMQGEWRLARPGALKG